MYSFKQENYKRFLLVSLEFLVELNGVEMTAREKLKIFGRYPKEAEEYEDEDNEYYKYQTYE